MDNVANMQLETARRAAALQAEVDAALDALLGDRLADVREAAATAAGTARRARLSEADAAARLAGLRAAFAGVVATALLLRRVGPPAEAQARAGGAMLALPAPAGWAPAPGWWNGSVKREDAAAAPAPAAPRPARVARFLGRLPFLRRDRKA